MNRGARRVIAIGAAICSLTLVSASIFYLRGDYDVAAVVAWGVLLRELYVLLPIWIWFDAPSYSLNRWLWTLLGYFLPLFGPLIYLYVRSQRFFILVPSELRETTKEKGESVDTGVIRSTEEGQPDSIERSNLSANMRDNVERPAASDTAGVKDVPSAPSADQDFSRVPGIPTADGINALKTEAGVEVGAKPGSLVCKNCGRDYPNSFDFCPDCGARLQAIVCKQCGRPVEDGNKYCPHCGVKIEQ